MKHHQSIKKASILYGASMISFFLALHVSIPSYFNSSFLKTFASENTISLIYLIISLFAIAGLFFMDKFLHKVGNLRISLGLILVQMFLFYGIVTSNTPSTIFALFILSMSITTLIGFTIDVFIQKNTDANHAGGIRGMVMTAINAAWIMGPLLGGALVNGEDYTNIYVVGLALLFPLMYLVLKNFSNFHDPNYKKISARETIARIIKNKDISKIFSINIILQTFYAWMVIYTPIYLHDVIKFSWGEISVIFTIMLIPFILVQLPLGKLADKKYGEKELLALGFLIMGISTGALVLFKENNLILWSIMLFITRIGAATAEIMIETYFFKKIDGRDPEILSMFRITRPLSYFVAPILATISLVYVDDSYLFVILGVVCLLMLYPILTIKDTR